MTARIGADDVAPAFESPRPDLLRKITGIEPEPSGVHVLLDQHAGVRSIQRLALSDLGGGIIVGFWPAELKPQADFLYQEGRGTRMVEAARLSGWDVRPSPHLAFFTAPASRRLYMAPEIDAAEYARRWEGPDGSHIGQYSPEEVRSNLWPWLKARGYASTDDDSVLEEFLVILGRRAAHLRPGMRFKRHWHPDEMAALGGIHELARTIRKDVNTILRAAEEPTLPAAKTP